MISLSSKDPGRVERFAGAELRRFLAAMDPTNMGPTDIDLVLLTDHSSPRPATPVHDGFLPEWSDRLCISSFEPRGLLNGVYDLVQRLGMRFPYPGIDRFPKEPNWKAVRTACKPRQWHIPSFRHRIWHFDNMRLTEDMIDWIGKMRINMIQEPFHVYSRDIGANPRLLEIVQDRGIELNIGGHGFDNWLPPTEHGREHPEYYATGHPVRRGIIPKKPDDAEVPATFTGGQLCLSHPDVVRILADNVASFLRTHPEVGTVSLWPNDMAGGWCECGNCLALEPDPSKLDPQTNTPSRSASYLGFIRKVGTRVHERCPDRRIEFAAFYDFATPPESEDVIPRENFYLGFLLDDYFSCQLHGHGAPCNRPRIEQHHRRWREVFPGEMYGIGYYADLCKIMDFPLVLVSKIKGDFEYYKELGVDSVSTLVVCAGLDYLLRFMFPNLYGYAALAWDHARSPGQILDELARAVCPESPGPVSDYLSLWDGMGDAHPDRHAGWIWTDFEPPEGPWAAAARFLRTRDLVDPAAVEQMTPWMATMSSEHAGDDISRKLIAHVARAYEIFAKQWALDTTASPERLAKELKDLRRLVSERGPFPAGIVPMMDRLGQCVEKH